MRRVRTCDFCSSDGATAFELLPPEFEPTEDEQRRVLLCPDCESLLADLIDPLLARAGASASERDSAAAAEAATTSGSDESTAPDREPAATADDEGVVVDAGDASKVERTGGDTADADGDEASGSEGDDEASGVEGDGDSAGEAADAAATDRGADPAPPAYGKVLRLLRNRDLPMERSAVEALAAGAYDLEGHEVDAVLDRAFERGDLIENGGRIRLPAE